ncbi:MAG: FAD-dependent oxidoreductase [Phycisphaerales bacterium]
MGNPAFDVAIIGGGPGGSTTGSLLKKYNPALRVAILEREVFPREHIGESQLPPIGRILHEMGAWDKVEGAGFPIKLGATYTWGKTTEPWVFGFVPFSEVRDDPRPAPYGGWRARATMQVDRAIYDDVLLKHAASLGCVVREGTRVASVEHDTDAVTALVLEGGERVTARYYVDASGNAAVLRRDLGVTIDAPTLLRNVAFWSYWERPELNAPIWEGEATRIQIRSLPYGWVWYIALSKHRTSVGIVCPAEYYRTCGKRPEQLYHDSLALEKQVSGWIAGGAMEGGIRSTTDWSFIAERALGPNWFLCGEALGFADPILSAGMTLTHTCAQHLAYTILELDRGQLDPAWLREQYSEVQRRRVVQHMRFAEYWYAGNGFFTAVRENCAAIAKESGLPMTPGAAFRWLSNGGVDDIVGQAAIGGVDMAGVKQLQWRFSEPEEAVGFMVSGKNRFALNLKDAREASVQHLQDGRIMPVRALRRGPNQLPLIGGYGMVVEALRMPQTAAGLTGALVRLVTQHYPGPARQQAYNLAIQCLEVMASNGWVECSTVPGEPTLDVEAPREGLLIYTESSGPPGAPARR